MESLLFILYPLGAVPSASASCRRSLHAVLIVYTAVAYGRIPLIGMHDTLGFLAFSIGAVALIAGWSRKTRPFSLF